MLKFSDAPPWAQRDHQWGPALWILSAPCLCGKSVERFVDFADRCIHFEGLRATGFSSGESILVEIAFQLFSCDSSPGSNNLFSRMVNVLDDNNLVRVIQAVKLARPSLPLAALVMHHRAPEAP